MKKPGISFAICTHNEGNYVKTLLVSLINFIINQSDSELFEIVIVDDNSTEPETLAALEMTRLFPFVRILKHELAGDYAAHKNFLIDQCQHDWILNLDADEILSTEVLNILPFIPTENPDVEAYWLPRINTVDGLTIADVRKWGWILTPSKKTTGKVVKRNTPEYELLKEFQLIQSEQELPENEASIVFNTPLVCWPDLQMRFFKNKPEIRWKNKVHEQLTGFATFAHFPIKEEMAILHHKDIERQRRQNDFYTTIK